MSRWVTNVIEPDPPPIKVEPVADNAPRRMFVVIGLIVGVLLVALSKPWGTSVSPTPAPPQQVAVARSDVPATPLKSSAPASSAVPREIQAARARMLCGSEPQWRLVTMETSSLGVSRTVYSDAPATASGPDDQDIPTVPVTAARLLGIGVCRPSEFDEQNGTNPVSGVSIWRIPALGAPSMVPGLVPVDIDLARVGEAYYRPDATQAPLPTDTSPEWSSGRYVVEISASNSHDQALWFALSFTSIQRSAEILGQ
ncbi:MAG TPA: hypothetical protein VH371_07985 [Candidatus Limnocylindrales bacterium]